jgi:hypothetical protein
MMGFMHVGDTTLREVPKSLNRGSRKSGALQTELEYQTERPLIAVRRNHHVMILSFNMKDQR